MPSVFTEEGFRLCKTYRSLLADTPIGRNLVSPREKSKQGPQSHSRSLKLLGVDGQGSTERGTMSTDSRM